MATKTDRIKKALELEGFKRIEHRSSDPCYVKEVTLTNRETGVKRKAMKHVWVLTGTVRYAYDSKRTEAISGEKFVEYLLKQHGLTA